MKNVLLYLSLGLLIACESSAPDIREFKIKKEMDVVQIDEAPPKFDLIANAPDDRSEIEQNLQNKIDNDEPLVVHCYVPLCDNENQGIVPTSKSLGDGFSLRTNLYWATTHGMKNFFVKNSAWKQLSLSNFVATDTVMERVAFERLYKNGARVILVCDAYRGDMMQPCVNDYLNALGGFLPDSINYKDDFLGVGEDADMMAFNGHNGLMDFWADTVYAQKSRLKDAVVVACASRDYFNPYFVQTNSYPLVGTTSLLWPGAMCLDRVISNWAFIRSDEEIKNSAGDAYNDVKECGQQAARNMFYSGW